MMATMLSIMNGKLASEVSILLPGERPQGLLGPTCL